MYLRTPYFLGKKPYYISRSKVDGYGLHSVEDFDSGVLLGLAYVRIKHTGDIDEDIIQTEMGRYCNHSKDPNMIVLIKGDRAFFETIKYVQKGDELSVDYRTIPFDGHLDFLGDERFVHPKGGTNIKYI